MKNQAFTLIELLVVVLIIGILAAIAVPQYQKAVAKSRASQLLTATKSLWEAQQRYFLQNNTYATKIEDLDISFANAANGAFYITDDVICSIEEDPRYVYCRMSNPSISYARWYNINRQACYAYQNDNFKGDSLCQELTSTNSWSNWCGESRPCHAYAN